MFKPVTSDQLSQYDSETIELYKKRESDPRLSYILSVTLRKQRHNMPVLISEPEKNQYMVQLQRSRDNSQFELLGWFAFFAFATLRFTKAYYPYGIIARRSIPRSTFTHYSYYLPNCAFFTCFWYKIKEGPRKQRIDMTCDSEL